jgi:hypothetical protein
MAFNKSQIKLGFLDPKIMLVFVSVFAAAIPSGVLNSFSTVIIRDMGFTTTMTIQFNSVGDAVQIVTLLISGVIILNVPNCKYLPPYVYVHHFFNDTARLLTATVANILCTIAAAYMAYLPRSNTWGRLVCFCLVNAQSVSFTVSSNMAGYTHRSLASALVFTA